MTANSKEVSPIRHFIGGWLGGSIACVVLSPLEVVKTRLQSKQNKIHQPLALTRDILKREGLMGFYRGLVPHLFGVGPSRAIYFGTFNIAKVEINKFLGITGAPLHLSAAAVGSIFCSTVMSPVWVVKTRLQLQQAPVEPFGLKWIKKVDTTAANKGIIPSTSGSHVRSLLWGEAALASASQTVKSAGAVAEAAIKSASAPQYNGMIDAFRKLYREEGILGFYRGLSASYLGVFETSLQFALYGTAKDFVMKKRMEEFQRRGVPLPEDSKERQKLIYTDSIAFTTSAVTKLIAALLTYPHEVLRTRMRENKEASQRGVVGTVKLIIKEEGARALYGGLSVHILRTVPNAAILLMVVEKVVGGSL